MNTPFSSPAAAEPTARVSQRRLLWFGGAVLGLCAGWLTLAGCATQGKAPAATASPGASPTKPAESAVLRVGVCAKLPPIVTRSGSSFTGFEVDFAKGLAASLGRRVEFVDLLWADLLPSLQSGRVDIVMSGVSMTPERMMIVDFARPYLRSGLAMVARRTEVSSMNMFFNKSVRIGVKPATTGQYYAQTQFPKNPRTTYLDPADAAKAMQDKKIDLFIIDAPIAWWMVGQYESAGITVMGDVLNTEYLAWAVAKGNTALLDAANNYLAASAKDGQQQVILRRWLGAYYSP